MDRHPGASKSQLLLTVAKH